ncbi:hypothetical protein GLAREA_11891 [Glarea lozoyensis ATCC 20868]|uniref:Uncharacterized protein n=1 Tax=Glarea lozoyensis (strain ATCC 20868 / MF5171) TaxID=1116229 RepID=S3D3X4_GLAL2|nr:uncharacterized protein GLAREA_11891 [Glarea lozoyensis ATCC 20868]EPE31809.1 hypothetical protein GLAREA_11891 [Glarea lozoyensis ATCC 20868]
MRKVRLVEISTAVLEFECQRTSVLHGSMRITLPMQDSGIPALSPLALLYQTAVLRYMQQPSGQGVKNTKPTMENNTIGAGEREKSVPQSGYALQISLPVISHSSQNDPTSAPQPQNALKYLSNALTNPKAEALVADSAISL